jgi:hypothetical protein
MATPQWVRFSAVSRSIEQVCREDLAGIFSSFSFKLWVINELGVKSDQGTFGDMDAPFIECDDLGKALAISSAWAGVALTFNVQEIHQNVSLNLWEDGEKTHICLYVAREMMWYESDDYQQGDWLKGFLLQFTAALGTDCCGYGRDPQYDTIYKSLEPSDVIRRLQDGSLLLIPDPVIHVISVALVPPGQIAAILLEHEAPAGFHSRQSTAGYHVLWNFGRAG